MQHIFQKSDSDTEPARALGLDSILFENSPDCVKLLDADGHLLAMNRNGQCVMEIDDFSRVSDLPWITLWPEQSHAAIRNALEIARNGGAGRFDAFCPTAKGAPKWWDVTVTPIYAADGRIERLLSVSRDVTAQRRANEEVEASRKRFALLLESSGEGIYGMGPDSRCTFMNKAGAASLGYRQDELIGQDLHALIHHHRPDGSDYPAEECPIFKSVAEGIAVRIEDDLFWRKDGTPVAVSYSVAPIVEEGRRDGAVVTFTDITCRKHADLALYESRERLEKVISQAATGVVQADADGRITLVNQKYCEMLGYAEAELIGASIADVTAPGSLPQTLDAIGQLVAGGAGFTLEKQYRRKDGSLLWATSSANALRSADGQYQGMVAIVVDITEQKRDAESLRKLAADLSESNRRKTEFLATLAHELRNPLAPIRTGLDLMRVGAGNAATVARVREMMERQVNHMVHLINDLLDIARVSSGKIELKKARVTLNTVVSNAVETSLPLIEAGRHELTVDLPDVPVWLDADHNRLAQVVGNLLTNAAKYTPDRGRIILSARVENDMAVISVTDTGIGIPAESLPHVFDMFSQVGRNMAHAQGGLGIGLSIVQQLVEMHDGTVAAFSRGPDQGSTFTVRLPVADAASPADGPGREDALEPGFAGKRPLRILVADDNKDAANSLSELLQASGYLTRVAHDGRQAVAMAESFMADVVLLDIGMPGMNGYEAARAIRSRLSLQPMVLVAVTGWGSSDDRSRSREAGFDYHLTKPVDMAALHSMLSLSAGSGSG